MKTVFRSLFFCLTILALSSCSDESTYDQGPISSPIKALIANEGQFGYGTASLTALMKDGTVKNDVFRTANGRPLGDVAQSITHIDKYYYVTLNNSRKIEVMSDNDFTSIETILTPDASIPTYMCHLGGDSMAVSEKGMSGRLMIVDLNFKKERKPIRRLIEKVGSANQMLLANNKLFIAGSTLRVFTLGKMTTEEMRTIKDTSGKEISVTGDSKIVQDKNLNIWVLTSKRLICIDPKTEQCIKELPFSGVTIGAWDGRLDISPNKETLYFTGKADGKKGILSANINDSAAPTSLTVSLNEVRVIYNMAISNEGTIFVCDVQYGSLARGLVHEFTTTGEKLNTFEAGIFPQYIDFTK